VGVRGRGEKGVARGELVAQLVGRPVEVDAAAGQPGRQGACGDARLGEPVDAGRAVVL